MLAQSEGGFAASGGGRREETAVESIVFLLLPFPSLAIDFPD